jgi:hypothetical protein
VRRAPRNAEELATVAGSESSVSFGDVGRDRDGGSGELVGENAVAARKRRRATDEIVGEVHGASIDIEILEEEGHVLFKKDRRVERMRAEFEDLPKEQRRRAAEQPRQTAAALDLSAALLSVAAALD